MIFRATPQWFISMDQAGLRKGALEAIAHVDWMPSWGEQRISEHDRGPSRLVRVAAAHLGCADSLVRDKEAGELHPRTHELIEEVAQRVEQGGIDAWFDLDAAELLGAEAARLRQGDRRHGRLVRFRRRASLRRADAARDRVPRPISISRARISIAAGSTARCLTSVAMHGRAPYRGVLTHGFTVDEKGRKMSKSIGNTLVPQKLTNTLGRRRGAPVGRGDRLRQ